MVQEKISAASSFFSPATADAQREDVLRHACFFGAPKNGILSKLDRLEPCSMG
jgi:hypothetical protein